VILAWEGRPLATIRRRDIIEIVDGIKFARGPYAAVNTQAWIKRCLNWCVEKAELEVSPAAGLRRPAPARIRERALSNDEVRRLWAACGEAGFPFGPFVQLLLLTACRRGELATLQWTDVDLAERTIVIPGARFKNGKPHLIPLSRQALALVEALPRFSGPYVFSTPGSEKQLGGFHWRQGKLDAFLDPPLDAWSLHDLRRTTRSGLARLRVPESVAERVLGHTVRGLERTYNLHNYADEKRQALQQWADHITRLIDGEAADNVVAIRG
jgi:integrase